MHVMNEQHENAAENMPTPEQLVARQLRLLRQGRGWSQQEVAEKMRAYGYQWSQATVTRLESASRPIRLNELADLAILYGVPVTQFLQSDVPDFEWDDLGALEREITNLTAQRDGLRERMEVADAAASSLERERAEAAAYIARIDGRLEALTRWHPQAARLSGEQVKAVAVSEPAQP
jgi:transcriptional regulator with XRE-family HTH domain